MLLQWAFRPLETVEVGIVAGAGGQVTGFPNVREVVPVHVGGLRRANRE